MEKKKLLIPLAALSVVGFTSDAHAAVRGDDRCAPVPPAPCYSVDDCQPTFCLGPQQVNPAVRPCTCDGDLVITLAGFYWNAHQDGMEYALSNCVAAPVFDASGTPAAADINALNNLIDATYEKPDYSWDFGFKLGLGYNTTHDGWDFGVMWTWFRDTASDKIEAEPSDNHSIIPLWSAYASSLSNILFASDVNSSWRVELNLIDIELGREMWMSKYLTFRPFVGLRVAFINQDWDLEHRGGSWSAGTNQGAQPALADFVDIDNDFKGVGLRGGFDTVWNFGRGWSLYGNLAANLVYGKFSVDHNEFVRVTNANGSAFPNSALGDKTKVLETEEGFRATRAMLDMALGFQWQTLFSECRYCFTFKIGWEHHMFFDQNQMWRVNRIGDTIPSSTITTFTNDTGENVYHQRRGDLDTQGWTLTLAFGF